ncbi:MAG: cache domain-containing protein, partial [Phormidium sp.]
MGTKLLEFIHPHPQKLSLLKSVGWKLFLSVLGGTLVGLLCASYLFYQELVKQSKAELLSSLEVQAESLEGSLKTFENTAKLVADAATTLYQAGERREFIYVDLIRRSLQTSLLGTGLGFGQPPEERLIIPERKYAYPFAIRDKSGKVIAKGGESEPEDFQESYFRDPIKAGKPIWIEPVRYKETTVQPPEIFVSTSYTLPFYNNKKQLLGVLALDLELGFISEKLSKPVMRNSGYFVLLSRQGN